MFVEQENDSEEEIFVYAEFEDSVNISNHRNIHILGVTDKKPIIQMDDAFFIGKYQQPMGTYMFFDADATPVSADPLFDKLPEKNLNYLCKAKKLLSMEHTYVTPIEGAGKCLSKKLQAPQEEIETVTFKTFQEAMDKFKNLSPGPFLNTFKKEREDIDSNKVKDQESMETE